MAKKTKVLYCPHCGRKTVHNLVGKEHVADDCWCIRALWGLGSLGLSELLQTKYYQCSVCKNIKEIEPL